MVVSGGTPPDMPQGGMDNGGKLSEKPDDGTAWGINGGEMT